MNFNLLVFSLRIIVAGLLPVLMFCHVASAQGKWQPKTYGVPQIQAFSPKDYQGKDRTWDIVQGKDDVMYFANSGGVLTYDGTIWEKILMPEGGTAKSIGMTDEGRIFVGGYNEIGYLMPDSLGNLSYQTLMNKVPEQYRAEVYDVWKTIATKDGIFFQGSRHILRYANDSIQVLRPDPEVKGSSFHLSWKVGDDFYVRENYNGLMKYEAGRLLRVRNGEKLARLAARFFFQVPGGYWGSNEAAMPYFFNEDGVQDTVPQLASTFEQAMEEEGFILTGEQLNDGNYLIGLVNQGVILLDAEGRQKYRITKEDGLSSNTAYEIFQDKKGDIWLAGGEGISFINYSNPFTIAGEQQGIDVQVHDAVIKQGKLYTGMRSGLRREEGSRFVKIPEQSLEVFDVDVIDGDLYAVIDVYVAQVFDDQPFIPIGPSSPGWTLIPSKNRPGYYLYGLYNQGVAAFRYRGKALEFLGRLKGYRGNAQKIVEDRTGKVWISDGRSALTRLDIGEKLDSVREVHQYGVENGLTLEKGNRVTDLFPKGSDYPLFTSGSDYFQYEMERDTFVRYTPLNGLVSGYKSDRMTVAADGVIYSRSGDRPIRFIPQEDKFIVDSLSMLKLQGIQTDNIIVLPNQSILFCAADGLYHFHPEKVRPVQSLFQTSIRKVMSGSGQLFGGGGAAESFVTSGSKLPFENNSISFQYSAQYYEESSKTQYQYQLEGFDEQWSEWTGEVFKEYNFLNEGTYTFKVRASNLYGTVSSTDTFQFVISPPWYRTSGSYVGFGGLMLLAMWVVVRLYTRKLEEDKKKLELIVAARTQEIASQAEQLKTKNEQLVELDQFKQDVTSMIVHDLKNPLSILIHSTEKKTERIARRMLNLVLNILDVQKFEDAGIQLTLLQSEFAALVREAVGEVQDLINEKNLTILYDFDEYFTVTVDREMIVRTLVNLLTNAIKFSPANGELEIGIRSTAEGKLHFSLKDEGPGIPADRLSALFQKFVQANQELSGSVKSTGLGLAFCRMAIEAHDGNIGVESKEGEGATFWFTLPGATQVVSPDTTLSVKEETGIRLSADEVGKISVILPQLATLKTYQVAEIEALLEQVSRTPGDPVDQWCQKITDAAYSANTQLYEELLSQISND